MTVTGCMLVGQERVAGTAGAFQAIDPASGTALAPLFGGATPQMLDRACALAMEAFDAYRETGLAARAGFLESIAGHILEVGDELIERGMAETGLPRARLEGERQRTMDQLRLFAQVVREGGFLEPRLDDPLASRRPLPRPDLRQRNVPVGPVAVFAPASALVRCRDMAQLRELAESLEGQLTASVHMEAADLEMARALLPVLERKAGRVLFNGFPTGVEVSHAMVHGGPHPATSDPRFTSVGTLAIRRFLRPVCYQDTPTALLPASLQDGNPLGLWRLKNGRPGRD